MNSEPTLSLRNSALPYFFTLLRIVVGWHFLYEGVVKLFNPGWTSASYLLHSQWIFAGFFRSLAMNPLILNWVDTLNIAGLILIGTGLMLGLFTRISAFSGVLLLMVYYFSNPPFPGIMPATGQEGHYLIINKNLIEAFLLVIIGIVPPAFYYSIDRIFRNVKFFNPVKKVPEEINHTNPDGNFTRRELVKNLISLPFLGGFVYVVARNYGWGSNEEKHLGARVKAEAISGATAKISIETSLANLKKKIPTGKIGNLDIGRIICGGNLISGFAHSRDLIYVSTFLKNYFTEQKVMETFWLCEACGINTTALRVAEEEIKILNNYRKRGGKIQWIAPAYPEVEDYKTNIDMAIDNGAVAVNIMGNVGDLWVREGRLELIDKTIHYIKSKGVPAGITGHQLETIRVVEEAGIPTDFYIKTLHPENYWSYRPEEPKVKAIIDNYDIDNYWSMKTADTISYMEKINKPWIAFKVLAAGALKPEEGLRFAYENGADFTCLGMFDFQVVEDANLVNDILDNNPVRKRMWMA